MVNNLLINAIKNFVIENNLFYAVHKPIMYSGTYIQNFNELIHQIFFNFHTTLIWGQSLDQKMYDLMIINQQ